MHRLEMSEVLHTHTHVLGQRGSGWGTNRLFFTTFNKYIVVVSLFQRFYLQIYTEQVLTIISV